MFPDPKLFFQGGLIKINLILSTAYFLLSCVRNAIFGVHGLIYLSLSRASQLYSSFNLFQFNP